jgi:hypothetical protein
MGFNFNKVTLEILIRTSSQLSFEFKKKNDDGIQYYYRNFIIIIIIIIYLFVFLMWVYYDNAYKRRLELDSSHFLHLNVGRLS